MMQIKDITNFLEQWAPKSLQESYDNCGLIVGNQDVSIKNALITLDVTEEVIDEAVAAGCGLIIAHHPLIFQGVKKIDQTHWIGRCLIKAIKNDIAIYAIHTNLDSVSTGVNFQIAKKLGIKNPQILAPKKNQLLHLSTFVPHAAKDELLQALHQAGAGAIGNYDQCSFSTEGLGRFRPSDHANPTIGRSGEVEEVEEAKIEVIVTAQNQHKVLAELKRKHPYEEVAYYLTPLSNTFQNTGSGMIGELPNPMTAESFVSYLKDRMHLKLIKSTSFLKEEIQKIAFCGGSGSFLLEHAKQAGATVFISSDFKYHDFFEANDEITIVDIGHYESEVFTKELLQARLAKKFTNFAFRLSQVDTNPIQYL